jgi:hypothetical protein
MIEIGSRRAENRSSSTKSDFLQSFHSFRRSLRLKVIETGRIATVSGQPEGNHLLSGCLGTRVQVLGQISEMDTLRAFLAAFNSHKRDRDLASRDLLYQFGGCQVGKIVPTYIIDRNDRRCIAP